ncbi:MAG TPA: alpha-2-macroglobulin family protein [Kofleriaceae bacterium]|nr:alpha-2-macroglobulin family protein [Kofleriaceae bacterium]
MRRDVVSSLALFATAALAAQPSPAFAGGTGAIEGTILDASSGSVVAGRLTVGITCGAVHKTGAVDAGGHFSIAGLPEGACTLTVGGGAYEVSTLAVAVTGGSIATVLVNVMTTASANEQRARMRSVPRPAHAMAGRGMPPADAPPMLAPMEDMGAMPPMPAMHAPPKAPAPAPVVAPGAPPPKPMNVGRAQATPTAATTPPAAPPPPPAAQAAPRGPAGAIAAAKPMPARAAGGGFAMPNQPVQLDARNAQAIAGKQLRAPHRGGEVFVAQQQAAGWAPVRVFPVPQYTRAFDGPRTDFRETVYWNPTVETSASGDADVAFVTSDAVTSFRASAEGFSAAGLAGGGQATFQSRLPLTLDAHLPVEVTSGDLIRLPITLANETDQPLDAQLAAQFGAAFKLTAAPATGTIHLRPHEKQSRWFPLEVVATDGSADVAIQLTARGLADELKKTIRVVPRGFPIEGAASGTAQRGTPAHHTLDLTGALAGSLHASVTMYPSPVAAMTQGMAGMIREPGGCFEQTSSTNYPNIMILGYLNSAETADPALVQKTQGVLDKGYKLLTGYETPEKGYEWFGKTPGHEALTAYGLMEFADMAKVYDVDPKMVERTADWLMSRRDHQGGFQRSAQALDSFGRAGPATTNAYILWALAEARRTGGLTQELATQTALGAETKDPYLLALAANTSLVTAPKSAEASAMVTKLIGLQAKDGSWSGAKESITMSGGESLTIESTALATLALIKASPRREYETQIRAAVDWLNGKRGGYGAWGNTQATVLGLKALTAYTEHARQMTAGGSATLVINGKDAGTITFDKGRRDALVWNDLAGKLVAGKNTIELRLDSDAALPYTIAVDYRSAQPASSPRTKVAVTTQLLRSQAAMGDGVTLRAHIENTTQTGIPMTLARIGLPGGTVFQTWQLKELRDKGLIDFYETRPREVILYWRAMAPGAKKDVDLNLLAAVPGNYEAPASSAYLYYTAEDKAWTKPVTISIGN